MRFFVLLDESPIPEFFERTAVKDEAILFSMYTYYGCLIHSSSLQFQSVHVMLVFFFNSIHIQP